MAVWVSKVSANWDSLGTFPVSNKSLNHIQMSLCTIVTLRCQWNRTHSETSYPCVLFGTGAFSQSIEKSSHWLTNKFLTRGFCAPSLTPDNACPLAVLHEWWPYVRGDKTCHPGNRQGRSWWVLRHRLEWCKPVTIWNTSCQAGPNPDKQPSSKCVCHFYWIARWSSSQVSVISGYSKGGYQDTWVPDALPVMGLASCAVGGWIETGTRIAPLKELIVYLRGCDVLAYVCMSNIHFIWIIFQFIPKPTNHKQHNDLSTSKLNSILYILHFTSRSQAQF